jgi:hypothetical protein
LISPSSVGGAIEVVNMVLLGLSPTVSAAVRDAPGNGSRLTLSAPEGAPAAAELAPVSGITLAVGLSGT